MFWAAFVTSLGTNPGLFPQLSAESVLEEQSSILVLFQIVHVLKLKQLHRRKIKADRFFFPDSLHPNLESCFLKRVRNPGRVCYLGALVPEIPVTHWS